MGPNAFGVKWNERLPNKETTKSLDLESREEDSLDSIDNSPTLFLILWYFSETDERCS